MIEHERKIQVLDLIVIIVLFIIGCVAGKLMMIYVSDTWVVFNGPAIGVLAIGEMIWWRLGKRIIKP